MTTKKPQSIDFLSSILVDTYGEDIRKIKKCFYENNMGLLLHQIIFKVGNTGKKGKLYGINIEF